jgi:hypothetical protein
MFFCSTEIDEVGFVGVVCGGVKPLFLSHD